MIRVEDLTKCYGATQALSGLSFEVAEGEVFGFIGPNGAGKTTLLRVLAGLSKPTNGRAEVAGIDVTDRPAAVRRLTGYMPDFFGVYNSMTAAEHLGFYAACYRIPRRLSTRVVDDLLELVRLNDKRDVPVGSLSRGMKQRLCLARALVHDPKVLLLDDPASGLDPRARLEMCQLVGALQEMGKTVLLSSHVLTELGEMCTSVGIVHQGRMIASGPARSMPAKATLLATRRARVRVRGDLADAERRAAGVRGVLGVRRAGIDTLDISHAGPGQQSAGLEGADLLRHLVLQGVAVADFRQDEGGLEELFMKMTCPEGDGPSPATVAGGDDANGDDRTGTSDGTSAQRR